MPQLQLPGWNPIELHHRFVDWCQQHGAAPEAADSLWHQLESLYGEDHRHYHHLGHIASSLRELDRTNASSPTLEGAIWFHDVIYDPRRGDNEAASIDWFRLTTGSWLGPSMADEVSRLIGATDFRKPRSDDPASRLIVDIDLAVLSSTSAEYDSYRHAIRREYDHIEEAVFRGGRAKVMKSFLARPIYRTECFRHREEQARENIARELDELGAR